MDLSLMKTRLLVFGDSWPSGIELADSHQQAFPFLIASKLDYYLTNYSKPATSVDQAVHAFMHVIKNTNLIYMNEWKESQKCVVLFCLTGSSRSWRLDSDGEHELHPQQHDPASLSYFSHIYSPELAKANLIKNIVLVQEICYNLHIPVFFITNWERSPEHHLIDANNIYDKSLIEILGMSNVDSLKQLDLVKQFATSEYIIPNISHPNTLGHKLIADELSVWIGKTNG